MTHLESWAEQCEKKVKDLSLCIAHLIKRALQEKGVDLADHPNYCGTLPAALMHVLRLAFGPDYRPEPVILENASEILSGLSAAGL